ncbi:MAG: NnrU family protein [Pseudomonadales bacterium]
MLAVAIAGSALLLTHLGISGTGVRARLVAMLGEGPYLGLYALLTLLTGGGLIWAYVEAPRQDYFWFPSLTLNWAPKILLWPASVLLVGGFMVRNPSMLGQGGLVTEPQARNAAASGVNRITRHPFQWAVMLWASSHLIANGDTASVTFFASFALLSAIGSVSLDAKKARQLGAGWQAYASITSNLPFAAIVRGSNQLRVRELWLPAILGTLVYVALFYGHEWLAGVGVY